MFLLILLVFLFLFIEVLYIVLHRTAKLEADRRYEDSETRAKTGSSTSF